jgi:hypothetical protein
MNDYDLWMTSPAGINPERLKEEDSEEVKQEDTDEY